MMPGNLIGSIKHFLDLDRFDSVILRELIENAKKIKSTRNSGVVNTSLAGKNLVCIFEKPSTRTRVSFQVGMYQLGGRAVILDENSFHMGRNETISDTGRVLSRFADAIMLRTDNPAKLFELASSSSVPVINGLTDASHPCQIMADILTFEECRGPIEGKTVAWSGPGNNVLNSWIHAAIKFRFNLNIGAPKVFGPSTEIIEWGVQEGGNIQVCNSAIEAVSGAHLVVTDTWVSMGETDQAMRRNLLMPFRVDCKLMTHASDNAIFMHCLPAHRGEEVTDEVLDGPQSVVWDEAENRLHAQKSILTWCLGV